MHDHNKGMFQKRINLVNISSPLLIGGYILTQLRDILYLDPGHAFGIQNRTNSFIQENFTQIDQYMFDKVDLEPFKCIFFHDFIDQEYLYIHKEKIASFLEEGKVVIFCGHLFKKWLPGCSLFTPKTINSFTDYTISKVIEHPIFEGVDTEDMTFNKGVAGFFARGTHSPVPSHAEVLLTLPGMPTTYIDRNTTKGTMLVHAGRDLFSHRMQNKSTDRISTQLLQWVHDEFDSKRGEK